MKMNISSCAIRDYQLYTAVAKLDKPLSDATHTLTEISFLVLRLRLENGIIGESYLLSFQYSPNAIRGALKDLLPLVVGFNCYETGRVYDLLNDASEYFGQTGINRWVQGLVNIGMWDAWGKTLEQPVHRLMGTTKERVPVYGSGGWLSYTVDELISEAEHYVLRGFKSVKIKVGSPHWKTDLERLTKLRAAIGSGVNIMIDANQGMNVASACCLASAAADLGIYWFEEPIHHQHFDGFATIKNKTGIALAMGEREFDSMALRELAGRKAIDIWQPDILRIGGADKWKQSASMAEGFGLSVFPHYYKDYDVPLLCTVPNGIGAESFDWIDPLIDHPIHVQDGYAYPREGPGWGFHFQDEYLKEIYL